MMRQLSPDPIISREVNISDLPSQYTEDIGKLRQVLNIPEPKDSMPVSSALVMGLNAVAQKQELRPKGLSTFLPAVPPSKRP